MDRTVSRIASSAAPVEPGRAQCSSCATRRVCISRNAEGATLAHIEALIQHAMRLERGAWLYCRGHQLRHVFAVRSGLVKTVMCADDGREVVVGVHGPGDVLGLDGLSTGQHVLDAMALRDTWICMIPHAAFSELCRAVPVVHQRLNEMLGQQVVQSAIQKMLCAIPRIEARVAGFLLEASRRNACRGYSASEFSLGMTRGDIGDYLGTSLETVCRVLSALARDDVIEVCGQRIRVLDIERLRARAGSGTECRGGG